MDSSLLSAIIGAGSAQMDAAINWLSQNRTNEQNKELMEIANRYNIALQNRANSANMELVRYQNAANTDLWRRQIQEQRANEEMLRQYNSPVEQMKRLQEAGLNPNLVYGNGATNTATAAPTPSAPKMDAARVEAARVGAAQIEAPRSTFGNALFQGLAMYKELQKQDADIGYIRSQQSVAEARAHNLEVNTMLSAAKRLGVEQSTAFAKMMQPYQKQAAEANIAVARKRVDDISSQIENRGVMQQLARERVEVAWKQASIAEKRQMLEGAKLLLQQKLYDLKSDQWNYTKYTDKWWEQQRIGRQIQLMDQMLQQRPQQLNLQKWNTFGNVFGRIVSGIGSLSGR